MKKLQSICHQLITDDDQYIENEVLKEIKIKDIVVTVSINHDNLVKIYSLSSLKLSDIIPIAHSFGFSVISEVSYYLLEDVVDKIFITKLKLGNANATLLKKNFQNIKLLFEKALNSHIKYDSLFKLIYLENFTLNEILLMRTFVSYLDQLILEFNSKYIIECLVSYPKVCRNFINYFLYKFDPDNTKELLSEYIYNVENSLKDVTLINDDRVLKIFYEVLKSVVRTNYFLFKDEIAIKIYLKNLTSHLKGIQPKLESFVYAEDFSGVHLRVDRVSRGGIRYSNRDDFRVEIKSLMATQEGKNAVIVPKGAKGGFVIKKDVSYNEFENYYRRFINSLLDMVDNKIDGKIIKNSKIISYDEDDSYFVVAADKGTSGMSDVANEISKERLFWISDAFASGSSNGYHHKKLGITAKGAIRSTQRFFIEKGVDFYKQSIDVVGIGSMSGDVFGNGMLESKYFRLIAAISHNEIFIDPNPDAEVAYEERKKLFYSKKSKWSDYDKSKISKGGGVFLRNSKFISLTKEIKELINSKKDTMSGDELSRELLKLPVDMLYFGGIGTYIKSSSESNIDIGDKENEFVRVDASDIEAFCICEGANLALSMAGRIEYSLKGGNLNLDSIDNSAGVDTSDHEVNLKIVLNSLVSKGTILEVQKNEILKSLSDFVVNSVLWTNYLQSLSISLDAIRSKTQMKKFKKSVFVLENSLDVFKRRYFNIPKDHDFEDVVDENSQLIRPVVATLTLYSKIFLQDLLNSSNMCEEDSFFNRYLFKYFPKSFSSIYEDEINAHPLRKEIISMVVANKIINYAGVTFISDFYELKEERFLEKIRSYLVMNQLLEANDIRYELYRKDYELNVLKQYSMLMKIEKKIEFNLRFFRKNFTQSDLNISSVLEYKDSIKHSIKAYKNRDNVTKDEDKIKSFFKNLDYMKYSLVIIKIKNITQFKIDEIASMLFNFVHELRIDQLLEIIEKVVPSNTYEEVLQQQMSELIEQFLVQIIKNILIFKRADESEKFCIEDYLMQKGFNLKNHQSLVKEYKIKDNQSAEELLVILNSILLLNESS